MRRILSFCIPERKAERKKDMRTALVGNTGFVGSNLASAYEFTDLYHSKNIGQAYGTEPDLLVYAGVRAEKFLADREPERDLQTVKEAFSNIQRINPGKLVLISTIDVYKTPVLVNEETAVETEGLNPYGRHRYMLEQWVREAYPDALIVRLPGLYGKNIKKNFIYDFIHVIPSMLKEEKYLELQAGSSFLAPYYEKLDNGFYKCRPLAGEEEQVLKDWFRRAGFSALNFTDSRSVFQFYPLSMLWGHLKKALELQLSLVNLAAEPIGTGELYYSLTGEAFVNELAAEPAFYDYRSLYAEEMGGADGYLLKKDFVMEDIKRFTANEK